jgi:2,3-bisphosphoglycerate-independent phosphoglycerate mutase
MPAERTTSERGISRLLGVAQDAVGSLRRASLLSLLLEGDLSSIFPGDPTGGFYVATPALFDHQGNLVRYVNDPENEHAFWTFFLDRFSENPFCKLIPIRKANDRIDRMLLVLSGSAFQGCREGDPPRSGLSASLGGFSSIFSGLVDQAMVSGGKVRCPSVWWKGEDRSRTVNGFWLWGGGSPLPSGLYGTQESSGDLRGKKILVADTLLVRALGRWMGFETPSLWHSTGDVDTDLGEKMRQVEKWARSGASKIVLHLEGFDMASHRKESERKVRFLERVDREVFTRLEEWLGAGLLTSVGITSDHQSSPLTGNHESGPVPALLVLRSGSSPGGGKRTLRMTERNARPCPLLPVDHWILSPFRCGQGVANQIGGKDLCLASS